MRLPALLLAIVLVLGGVTLLVVLAPRPPDAFDEGDQAGEGRGPDGEVAPLTPTRLEPAGGDDPAGATGGTAGRPADEGPRIRVSGTVLDDRGDPVGGAFVVMMAVLASGPPVLVPPEPKTDAAGRFAISQAAQLPFNLRASADGYEPGYAEVRRPGDDVEIRLRRLLRILGDVVDDATGERVGKGTLLLRRLLPTGEPEDRGLGYEMKEGRFVLPDLAAGRYVLDVSVPGYDAWTSEEIRLSRDEPDTSLEVRVGRSGPWGAVTVSFRDPSGAAVNRANRVLLHDPDSGFLAMTALGVDAPVRLEAPEGQHVLQAIVDGFLPEVRSVEVPAGRDAELTVTLRAAGHVRIGVVDAERRPSRDFRLAIFDADGEELPYDLRLFDPGPTEVEQGKFIEDPGFAEQGTLGKNQVIPTGPVELKNLPPGRYRIVASREGVNPAEATVDVEASSTAEVTLILR